MWKGQRLLLMEWGSFCVVAGWLGFGGDDDGGEGYKEWGAERK